MRGGQTPYLDLREIPRELTEFDLQAGLVGEKWTP